ncbi:MAG: hypothetical protein E7537_06345 [Ruminococcaceae bacterium]|nr:hypothetical protein [Oscillospiraceae bacterium]
MKIDKTVIKETKYIASFVIIFSVLMQAVFLIISKWDYTVLLGNLWGIIIAVGNFFVMGLFVQKAVTQDAKDAKQTVRASQSLRMVAIFVLAAVGLIIFKQTPTRVAIVLPLVFPRIAIMLRPIIYRNI